VATTAAGVAVGSAVGHTLVNNETFVYFKRGNNLRLFFLT
jgi:hypothetical protein